MRALIVFSLAILAGFPLLAAAGNVCSPSPRAPGTPIPAPHAAFEAYVVDVQISKEARSTYGIELTRQALVEVVRSFHGPYNAGQQVETFTLVSAHTCGGAVEAGGHVVVVSESGGPFEIVQVLPKTQEVPGGPFAALAYVEGEFRHSSRRMLKNASLRGAVGSSLAAELRTRAKTGKGERCEIVSDGNYAQVSWGKAFGGNDARSKVIFERADNNWVEILRYQAPASTPARNRTKRNKQRVLWAEERGLRTQGDASADSTS